MAFSPGDLMAIVANPIRPDRPGGDAVTYEPEFEAIKTEIARLDSLTGQSPNWAEILSNAITLLQSKGKDLTVASYLVLALFRNEGYAGLAAGLAFYRDFMTNCWETLYPELSRMRGRIGAVTWLNDRVSGAVTRKAATAGDNESAKACAEFGNDAPSLGDLRRSLDDAVRASAPAAQAAAAAGSTAAGAAGAAVDSPDAAMRSIRNLGAEARRVAEYLVRTDPGSTVPYLVTRGLAWGSIRQLPPDKDGVTQFPAPDANIQMGWEKMVQAGQWAALLADAEPRIITTPLWLDINYHVALALENLGHAEARDALT